MSERIQDQSEDQELFLFNDYFSDDEDRGVEVRIPHKGKVLTFRVKKVLTLKERQKATDAAIKIDIDLKGQAKLSKVDQATFTSEIVLVALKYWPFEYKPGKPVPINRETVSKLDSTILDALASQVLQIGQEQQNALVPFEMKSGAAS